MFFFGQL